MIQFHQGQGDVTLLKPSGRTLNVTIGPGLPSSTSELLGALSCYCMHSVFVQMNIITCTRIRKLKITKASRDDC